jgi:hypothetical protein
MRFDKGKFNFYKGIAFEISFQDYFGIYICIWKWYICIELF